MVKKQKWFIITVLCLTISMVIAPGAGAADPPPGTTVVVDCEGVRWVGTVPDGSTWTLQVRLQDEYFGFLVYPMWHLDVTGSFDVQYEWEVALQPSDWYTVRIRDGSEYGNVLWAVEGHLDCPTGEGCTPGYWKNPKHYPDWVPTGLSPGDDFDTTFGVDLFDPDITLEDAVNANGGGANKLARHGTAGLLSALHPAVDYPYTAAEVIAFVQAGNVAPLVEANELGCRIP